MLVSPNTGDPGTLQAQPGVNRNNRTEHDSTVQVFTLSHCGSKKPVCMRVAII